MSRHYFDRRNGERRTSGRNALDRRTVVVTRTWAENVAMTSVTRNLSLTAIGQHLVTLGYPSDGPAFLAVKEARRRILCQRHREELDEAKVAACEATA